MNQVTIQKIANGYIVSSFPTGNPGPMAPVMTYCTDLTAVGTMLATAFAS